jgi:L-ascorbate metabolism protein UlaG (beta-lactamase superfamily)
LKIKFLGHASFQIEIGGKTLILDPFISANPLASHINIDEIKCDYVLLSHGHQDHVLDAEKIAKNNNALIISNYEVTNWFTAKGCKGHPLNHGGKKAFDFGTVKYVNAIHTSSMPDGSYGGNPGGFVIWNNKQCFYFAGDTALTMDMQIIPDTCPKLDIALLPIGDNFTMGFEDAAIAAMYVDCKNIIPYHYNTFGWIEIDLEQAKAHFESKNLNLTILEIGNSIDI